MLFITVFLQSCFLFKVPIAVRKTPITDTVQVYHLIVTENKKKLADSLTISSFSNESKRAFDWITREARIHQQKVTFKERWIFNKDSSLGPNFVHKLPDRSLQVLQRHHTFKVVTRKKTKKQEEKIENVNWNRALFDSLVTQVKDSAMKKILLRSRTAQNPVTNDLVMLHLLKVKKSSILGFYGHGRAFIGNNRSVTIAHETLHHLGAPDLYIHRYWFGRRKKIVKRELQQEVMDFTIGKTYDCQVYYISNYSAYTLGWVNALEQKYTPLLKQNLMAKFMFYFGLFF